MALPSVVVSVLRSMAIPRVLRLSVVQPFCSTGVVVVVAGGRSGVARRAVVTVAEHDAGAKAHATVATMTPARRIAGARSGLDTSAANHGSWCDGGRRRPVGDRCPHPA